MKIASQAAVLQISSSNEVLHHDLGWNESHTMHIFFNGELALIFEPNLQGSLLIVWIKGKMWQHLGNV